jgi:hypothetical protein
LRFAALRVIPHTSYLLSGFQQLEPVPADLEIPDLADTFVEVGKVIEAVLVADAPSVDSKGPATMAAMETYPPVRRPSD